MPDLQIQVTRPLGDGSSLVCDDAPPMLGGVPAINPPSFDDTPSNADRLNDLACRFIDGGGNKIGRKCGDSTACVLGEDGIFGCVTTDATVQFCGFIGQALTFPPGDTLVTVRVRDVAGQPRRAAPVARSRRQLVACINGIGSGDSRPDTSTYPDTPSASGASVSRGRLGAVAYCPLDTLAPLALGACGNR